MTRAQDTNEAATAGPIAEDWRLAASVVVTERTALHPPSSRDREMVSTIARALASQRAEIHARYEQLAKWADQQADSREHFAKVDPSYRMTLIPYRAMAERIRMAAGEPPTEAPLRYQNNPATWPNGVRLGCDVCGLPSTWTSTPGGIRFCDDHEDQR